MIGVNLTGMGRKVVRMSLMNALEEEDSRGMISTGDVMALDIDLYFTLTTLQDLGNLRTILTQL